MEQACLRVTRDYWTWSWLPVSLERQKTRASTGSSPLMTTVLLHTLLWPHCPQPTLAMQFTKVGLFFPPSPAQHFSENSVSIPLTACQLLLAPVENSGCCSRTQSSLDLSCSQRLIKLCHLRTQVCNPQTQEVPLLHPWPHFTLGSSRLSRGCLPLYQGLFTCPSPSFLVSQYLALIFAFSARFVALAKCSGKSLFMFSLRPLKLPGSQQVFACSLQAPADIQMCPREGGQC